MSRVVREGIAAGEVQTVFNDFVNNGYMPTYVKTNSDGSHVTVDFIFDASTGAAWECHHWLNPADYNQKSSDLGSLGFNRVCANSFVYQGNLFYCALWIKA